MFKFAVKGDENKNYLVGFGLSQANINLLAQDKPIVFDSSEVGLNVGKILIIYDSNEWKQNELEVRKHFKGYCFVVGDKEIESLKKDGCFHITFNNTDFVFLYGKDEFEFYEKFKSRIGPTTVQKFEGWSPTDRYRFGNEN